MAIDTRRCFWFGTEERAGWFATPLKGAESTPSAWGVDGTLLNGGGYGFNSFGSHKRYTYEWPQSSSPETAQMMKSYRDGTYGRGLLYFLEPGIYRTNILPAHWADPSMSVNNEAPSLVYGIDPIGVPTSGGSGLQLPIVSAQYDLSSTPPQAVPTPDSSVFLPIPTGHTLFLGAFYSATGSGGVFATPVNNNGTLGTAVKLTEKPNTDADVVTDQFSGDISGVRLWVGRQDSSASSVTIAAMSGRLMETSDVVTYGPWTLQQTNSVTTPSFESGSGTVEVRRNHVTNPAPTSTTGWLGLSSASISYVAGEIQVTAPGAIANEGVQATTASRPSSVASGGIWVKAPVGADLYVQTRANGSTAGAPQTNFIGTGDWQYVTAVNATSAITGPHVIMVRTRVVQAITFSVRQAIIEEQTFVGSYFDGGVSPDSDMTASWTGSPNASASILTGTTVAGIPSGVGCVAIRSEQWVGGGQYSLRLIPTSASSNVSYTSLSFSGSENRGTAVITRRILAPLTGSTWSAAVGRIYWNPVPQVFSNQAPNVPGEAELRVYADPTGGSASTIVLPHGGLAGSGDVWYDLAGIFSGDYSGSWFDGSTPDTDTERYSWAGPSNASPSTFETRVKSGSSSIQNRLTAGPWIGGQGHSGCRFLGTPSYVSNGPVEGGRVGFAASFVEVGSWAWG